MILDKAPNLNRIYRFGFDICGITPPISSILLKRVSQISRRQKIENSPFVELGADLQYPLDQIVNELKKQCWDALKRFSSGPDISSRVWICNSYEKKNQEWTCDAASQAALGFLISLPSENPIIEISRVIYTPGSASVEKRIAQIIPPDSEKASVILFNPSSLMTEYRSISNLDNALFIKGHFGEINHD